MNKMLLVHSVQLLVWVLALSSTLCSVDREAPEVMAAMFGELDFSEIEETLFDVELLKVPQPESTLPTSRQSTDMVSRHGQHYSCQLPHPLPATDEDETALAEINVTALLVPLADDCLIKTVGWWTYEYCHGQFVRQYHMEAGKILGKSIYLGYHANETVWDEEHIAHIKNVLDSVKSNLAPGSIASSYHLVNFTNGTKCDRTGQPRRAVVKLSCGPGSGHKLFNVTEQETCSYILSVQTELLCQHPLFHGGQGGVAKVISCSPVVSDETYNKYMQQQELQRNDPKDIDLQDIDHKDIDHKDIDPNDGDAKDIDDDDSKGTDIDVDGEHQSPPNNDLPIDSSPPNNELVNAAISQVASSFKKLDEMSPEEKHSMVEEVQRNIDSLYQRFQQELAEHELHDPLAGQLKESSQKDYQEFEKLMNKNKNKKSETDDKEPYQVQGTEEESGRGGGGRGELLERETVTVERLTDVEEAINQELQEQMRQNGIEGRPEVKVLALPQNMMDMLLDQEEEDEDSVRLVIKLDGGQAQTNTVSQLLGSLFGPPGEQPPEVHPDAVRGRELEESYNQVWTEPSDNDNKRKQIT